MGASINSVGSFLFFLKSIRIFFLEELKKMKLLVYSRQSYIINLITKIVCFELGIAYMNSMFNLFC